MQPNGPSREHAAEMFDRISGTYDLLNHLLSLGLDFYWRARLARHVQDHHHKVLDCATGTGDQLLALLKKCPEKTMAWGIDPSSAMLERAKEKFEAAAFSKRTQFLLGKADDIPFEDAYFDLISMSFGIRNVENIEQALNELRRVLHKEGVLLILEFSLPHRRLFRAGHSFYLRSIVPTVGKLVSKNLEAYRYLADTIETFPCGEAFCNLVKKAGFSKCEAHPLTCGITTLYTAYR